MVAYGQMKKMWMVRQKTHHCSRPAAQAHSAHWMVAIPTKYDVHTCTRAHARTHARKHARTHACASTCHWITDYVYFKMWWETLFGILTDTCFTHHSCSNNSADPYSSATVCPIFQQFELELKCRVFFSMIAECCTALKNVTSGRFKRRSTTLIMVCATHYMYQYFLCQHSLLK